MDPTSRLSTYKTRPGAAERSWSSYGEGLGQGGFLHPEGNSRDHPGPVLRPQSGGQGFSCSCNPVSPVPENREISLGSTCMLFCINVSQVDLCDDKKLGTVLL